MFEEDSVLGEEEEEERGRRNKVLAEVELLVCKTKEMVGNMMTTGGKVLLTALLGLTGKKRTDRSPRDSRKVFEAFLGRQRATFIYPKLLLKDLKVLICNHSSQMQLVSKAIFRLYINTYTTNMTSHSCSGQCLFCFLCVYPLTVSYWLRPALLKVYRPNDKR